MNDLEPYASETQTSAAVVWCAGLSQVPYSLAAFPSWAYLQVWGSPCCKNTSPWGLGVIETFRSNPEMRWGWLQEQMQQWEKCSFGAPTLQQVTPTKELPVDPCQAPSDSRAYALHHRKPCQLHAQLILHHFSSKSSSGVCLTFFYPFKNQVSKCKGLCKCKA